MSEISADTTEDAFLGGRLRLRQPRSGHRSGHDAMLLAAAIAARPGDRVVEFGAGVGAAGLALARRAGAIELTLVEIDPRLAALARDNAAANDIAADVRGAGRDRARGSFRERGPQARQRRRRPDESALQRCRAPSRLAGRGPRFRPRRRGRDAGGLDYASRRLLKSGGALDADLARRWPRGGAGSARARLWQPRDPACACRRGKARDSRAGSCRQGRAGADANLTRAAAQ